MQQFEVDSELTIRTYSLKDAEALFRAIDENRAYLRKWLPWLDLNTRLEDSRNFINHTHMQTLANKCFQGGIWYQGELAGGIGFHNIDWQNKNGSMGYWVAEKQQGKGIVTRSVSYLVDHAFGKLELNRLEIRCATENLKSRAIPERLGFKSEGVIRQAEWLYDTFVDHVVYGMLKTEWESRHG